MTDPGTSSPAKRALGATRIVIIDDDERLNALLTQYLARFNVSVRSYAHPRDGLRALKALDKLKDGAAWADVVEAYSDAPGPNNGALGRVSKEDLDPSFAAAAFSLDVSEVSYVVESFRGFHVIMRTE